MSDEKTQPNELEDQEGIVLPEREVMSIITPSPAEKGFVDPFPVEDSTQPVPAETDK